MKIPGLLVLLALVGCKDDDSSADDSGCTTPTWFADADRDGYGTPERSSCEEEPTFVQQGGDCDDDDNGVHPGATELCDGLDNNCDGQTDEGTSGTGTYYRDVDGDGYGVETDTVSACGAPDGYAADPGDCDDGDADVHPNAAESCDNLDSDCDGDLNDPESVDATPFYTDADRDGYGNPESPTMLCESAPGVVGNDQDCEDTDADIHPNAAERCNGADDDCDEVVDEGGLNPATWYPDDDEDGFGDTEEEGVESCTQPPGHVATRGDCDDGNGDIFPGANEICGDGLDNDCSGDGAGCALAGNLLLSAADRVYTGEASGNEAGFSINPGRGDHDGDGVDDLLISAAEYSGTTGRVYLFEGPIPASANLSSADAILTGAASGDAAGIDLAWLGDTNGDGRDDALVGAWREDTGATNAGAVYVLNGPFSTMNLSAAPVVLIGQDRNDYFGTAVASAGDLNGDGRDDVLVGAYGEDAGGTESGAAMLFYGPPQSGESNTADALLEGLSGDQAGFALAAGEDLDGDGAGDILVGAVAGDGATNSTGVVYVVSGAGVQDLSLGDMPTLGGEATTDYFGFTLDIAPDLNGDGFADAVVGAYNANSTGTAYAFYGPITADVLASNADVRMLGVASGDLFGFSVSSAGDPDGDGTSDLLVGAPESDGAVAGSGAAWLFYAPLPSGVTVATADGVLQGGARGDAAGSSAGTVGDVNDDGTDDIFVSAYLGGSTGGGEVYVLFGGAP